MRCSARRRSRSCWRRIIRFAEEAAHLLPLPDHRPERLVSAKADKQSQVRFENCFYSMPTRFAGTSLTLKARPFELEIHSGKERIAVLARSFEKGRYVTELDHYLDLLERKPRAARSALPVIQAGLPDEFESFRRRVEDGTGDGDRRFVGVLRLTQQFGVERVKAALSVALARGVREPADIRLLVMRQFEEIPTGLEYSPRTGLAAPVVRRSSLAQYRELLEVAG